MRKKMTALLVALFAMTLHLSAQVQERDYQLYPYMFGSLQGGVLKTYTGSGIDRKFKPMGAVSFGAFFTQVFGARAQFGASQWKMDIPGTGTDYKNKYYDIGVDLLFNLSNVVFPDRNNFVNVIAIAGVPFSMVVPHTYIDNYRGSITTDNRKWKMGWKGGGMLDFNISKNFSFNLEAGSNYIRPRSVGTYDKGRWWPYALAGVTFKFGHKKVEREMPTILPVVREEPVVEEKPVVVEQPKPQPKQPKPEPMPEPKKAPEQSVNNIFFTINSADIRGTEMGKINGIVDWANRHPEAQIMLTGYADRETGNPNINQGLSERRAKAVKQILLSKGIAEGRITTDAKGDKVQPFSINEENRAVVVLCQDK